MLAWATVETGKGRWMPKQILRDFGEVAVGRIAAHDSQRSCNETGQRLMVSQIKAQPKRKLDVVQNNGMAFRLQTLIDRHAGDEALVRLILRFALLVEVQSSGLARPTRHTEKAGKVGERLPRRHKRRKRRQHDAETKRRRKYLQICGAGLSRRVPRRRQFALWLSLHPLPRMVAAISETCWKQQKRVGSMTANIWCGSVPVRQRPKESGKKQSWQHEQDLATLIWERCPAKFSGTQLVILFEAGG